MKHKTALQQLIQQYFERNEMMSCSTTALQYDMDAAHR
jgi:hypothetical protein